MEKVKLCYLITELNVGGAEKVVERLAIQLSKRRYNVSVACLYDPGAATDEIIAAGVPIVNLGMRGKWDLRVVYRLFRLLHNERIQILHSHMFHANLLAALVGRLAEVPVIIATRHSIDIGRMRREQVNRWARGLCDAVVAVSEEVHEAELQRSQTDMPRLSSSPTACKLKRSPE